MLQNSQKKLSASSNNVNLRAKFFRSMDLFSCLSSFVFCSLSSGSNGNCYFVGTSERGILIDVGIPAAQIKTRLQEIGYQPSQIDAVFLTHDHIDHIKGLQTFINKYHIPFYADPECWHGVQLCGSTKNTDPSMYHPLQVSHEIGALHIESFPVSHDGRGAHGYYIVHQGRGLTIATDLGFISDEIKSYLQKADSMVLESNYDYQMLMNGNYPYVLKKRISSNLGHLSNETASDFVARYYRSDIKNIMLCHLSENNNNPAVAMQCFYHYIRRYKVKLNISTSVFPLPRNQRTELIGL